MYRWKIILSKCMQNIKVLDVYCRIDLQKKYTLPLLSLAEN